ncbi:phage replisome organizer N-terminal domain-containing protein [Clostridium sp. YIM B02505]|uniref:Phage replisome organizer N-terminal domain-containing protein n=1 Tax=Clostridium yunnanense TaxID=2800325 RepID=A0ABS1EN73_9CLOT|nr:phage replisome organizer N-terminal domain-containing protein [Clostridium yunnanense]MBK1810821.1 phage replisome organizer N-terminal domain-containing protein [Clostridium yunnanense]
MRERKYVKFRVDMYEDTKFKIIDLKPERDVIHYIWNRIVLLAGKVNLEGELFLSKNIPYTIETLAIELNRDIDHVKLALEVFIELEMVELIDNKVYRLRNFAKHQNIKAKEKQLSKQQSDDVKVDTVNVKENYCGKAEDGKNEEKDNKTIEKKVGNTVDDSGKNLDIVSEPLSITENTETAKNNLLEYTPKALENKKNRKGRKNSVKSTKASESINQIVCYDEVIDDMNGIIDEVGPLGKNEKSIAEWRFG